MEVGKKERVRATKSKKPVKEARVRSAEEEARRREVLKESLREKLELERRALQVVQRLLEDNVTEDFLTDCVRLITPANYRDLVEERSIVRLCGYPLCSDKLTHVPSQQFKISTKTNKVYDITERKCFCSNFCFKASKFLEVQISKSPLWLRKEERPADVKLMKKGDGGSSGLEVKLSDRPVNQADIENPVPESSVPHGSSAESEESDEEQGFVSSVVSREPPRPRVHWGKPPERPDENQINKSVGDTDELSDASRPISEQDSSPDAPVIQRVEEAAKLLDQCDLSDRPGSTITASGNNEATGSCSSISQVGMSKKGAEGLKNLLKNNSSARSDPAAIQLSLLETLRQTLTEWRTEETMRFLCGPDYTWQAEATPMSDDEAEELDEDDLEDLEEVTVKLKGSGRQARPTAAAPAYERVRREADALGLRVQSVYRGSCVLPEEVNSETAEDIQIPEKVPVLPPVDSQAQHAIQKRIAVEKICRSLRDIIGPLGVTMSEIIDDLNSLVRTFRFTNVNIIHRPPEWTLISVALLSALADVSPSLRESMAKASSAEHISSLMKELRLKDEDLQSLVLLFKPKGSVRSSPSDTGQLW